MPKPLVINVGESIEALKNHIKTVKTATRKMRYQQSIYHNIASAVVFDEQTKLLSDSIVKSTYFREWVFACNYWTIL